MLGIIGAMAEEVAALKEKMELKEEKNIHQVKFYIGLLNGKETVLMQGGIGKVNASYSATLLMEHFDIDHLINIGSAGGLKLSENVGDVVIASEVIHHDVDCVAFNYPYGKVPDMPLAFQTSQKLLDITTAVLDDLDISHHTGLIVSGDQFVSRNDQVQTILAHFPQAIACEMEAASISQIAYIYQVPFIILRSLSDVFGKGNNDVQFDTYLALASENSAKLAWKVAGAL